MVKVQAPCWLSRPTTQWQGISTFEGGQRVPCVMWGPSRIPAGTECDQLVSTLDILPTIAGLTGTELPKNSKIDGLDASVLLMDEMAKTPRHEFLYYTSHGDLEGIRKGKWKLLVKKPRHNKKASKNHSAAKPKTLLFHLSQDISEKHNIANANPDVVAELTARMRELDAEIEKNTRTPWTKQ